MNKKIVFVIVGIIVLVGVFYGGMSYGQSKATTAANAALTTTRGGQFGINRGNRGNGGGFVSGQIISKDATSITIKLMDNGMTSNGTTNPSGSKIIFLDSSTMITKTTSGSATDLATGTQVSVAGTTNSDGSVTARSIQIRPQMRPTQ